MIPVVFINCKKIDYIGKILVGEKKFETRHFNTLGGLVGRRVLFAETGSGKPKIRCSAVLKRAVKIDFLGEWAMCRDVTCVPEGSEHDWNFDRPGKWLYELTDVQPCELPWKEGKRHGRVWMEYEEVPEKVKLHARLSVEFEITREQLAKIIDLASTGLSSLCDIDVIEINDILQGKVAIPCDWDEGGYIPGNWLTFDAVESGMYEVDENGVRRKEN